MPDHPRARFVLCCVLSSALLTACSLGQPAPTPTPTPQLAELRLPGEATTVLDAPDAAGLAAATSAALFVSAPVAVLAPAGDLTAQLRAASVAVALGAPLLLVAEPEPPAPDADGTPTTGATETPTTDPDATAAELDRLGVLAVITVGQVEFESAVPVFPAPADDAALAELVGVQLEPRPLSPAMEEGQTEVETVASLDRQAPQLLLPEWAEVAAPAASPTPGTEGPSLPLIELAEATTGGLVLTTGDPFELAAVATARAAGVAVLEVASADPRRDAADVQYIAQAQPATVIGLAPAFGDPETLAWKMATAATGVELPGGGQMLFPGRRFVALYGTPHYASLGSLGEQELTQSIARAQGLAAEYQALTTDVVVPAFEAIVTVASAGAGADGNYSEELPVDSFIPLVEAARDAGAYVVLDLQPGRTDFLTQAQLYEPLLLYPNVGLALDAEWRLGPGQVHLVQIGSVGIDEVNAVADYLAQLTRSNNLPQKLLVLHQFMHRMITDRERLNTSHEELAVLIHVDGFGAQGSKLQTWASMREGAPAGVYWGWKNFIDEDRPMMTPAQTYQVQPAPEFVSYQ